MSPVLRVGLVGCGRLAQAGYVPAAARVPGVDVVAVADPSRERVVLVGDALGLADEGRYGSAEELLGAHAPHLDAVVVTSPVAKHVEVAARVAEAGLPALVEKPPAPDRSGARELAALSPAPLLGFNRRFSLGRDVAVGEPADGELIVDGKLHYRRESWDPVGDLGDAWLDLGPHLVDLALLAARRPLQVAEATIAERRAQVELRGDGATVRLDVAIDQPHGERLRVVSDGRTVSNSRAGGLRGMLRVPGQPHPLVASLAAQLEAFAAACAGRESRGPRPGTAEEGVAVMDLIDGARL